MRDGEVWNYFAGTEKMEVELIMEVKIFKHIASFYGLSFYFIT